WKPQFQYRHPSPSYTPGWAWLPNSDTNRGAGGRFIYVCAFVDNFFGCYRFGTQEGGCGGVTAAPPPSAHPPKTTASAALLPSSARRTHGPPVSRMQKTWNAKPGEVAREWYVVDAEGQILGRLATRIADTLRGKDKPQYTPHTDTGDFVVVVNAEKIGVTGKKLDEKLYRRHSGYPGGLRERPLREQLERRPT